jgi:thiol-disulfide isomerase/thioredoxin
VEEISALMQIKMKKTIIVNTVLVLLLLAVVFIPTSKAILIQGLMEIGLFKPNTTHKKTEVVRDLSTIKFKDAKGKIISLADFKGKVVFLNFWATWCPPCLAEMPSVNRFYEQFKDKDVIFIMVDADSDFVKAQAYMDRKQYKLPVYAVASDLPKNIFKGTLPTTIVFDRQGRISFQGEGAANYSSKKFVGFIEELLKISQ